MANARDVFNVDANKAGLADPQNRQFDLSFPYLSQSHVSVTVNGTATTAFTFATSTRIQLNTGPTAGDVVVLKRATSPNTRLVDYQTGSVLSDEILDKDSLQAFYLAQEANDVAEIVLSKNASDLFDAGAQRITNVADPTAAQDVATKNYLENTWLSSSDKTQLNALNTTNLNTVAGSVSNVNTVAGAITNVNTVAGKSTEITALATTDNIQNMDDLAATGVIANIATVAGVAPTMSAAATNATNAAASASAAANSAAAAAASFDTFDDRYLGSKSSEPSVDNDGNALVSGSLFFDSAVGSMKVYDGGNWILATSAGAVSLLDYEFTATAGQTTFSGADNNSATLSYSAGNLIVTLNGIVLDNGSDYTATSGTSIVLASGAALNDHLAVVAFKSFTVADTVAASTGGTFAGNVAVTGTISTTGKVALPATLGSAGQVLTVNSGASAAAWASPAGSFASLSDTTVSSSDPTLSTNPASGVGHIWINTTTGFMYVLKDATAGNNYWENVGIGSVPVAKLTGTGGTVTTAGGYTYHTFTSSGTFTATGSGVINYLLVAGGGGGGGTAGGMDYASGGGGAGGILYATTTIGSASFTVTVGAGGAKGVANTGSDGGNTTLANNADAAYPSAIGGGGGGYSYSNQLYPGLGRDGGSGGGGGAGGTGGAGTSGQGNAGGNNPSGVAGGGGGGGAGAAGANGTSTGGAGGAGINTYSTFATATSTGDSGYYGGGGAGGPNAVAGGAGGGADSVASGAPSAAQANTGGGGAGNGATGDGSNGGSGIVIIRYPT